MPKPTPHLNSLIEGYRRFRENDYSLELERWEALREGQSPQVMVIACSDSRVDPATIFGTRPGEVFVVRVPWPGGPITERAEVRREIVSPYDESCRRLGIPPRPHA